MAYNVANIGTSAVLIHTVSSTSNETLFIHIDERSPLVYLGPNSSVSTSNGLAVGGGSDLTLFRTFGQSVYAICASTGGGGTLKWSAQTS